MEEEIYLSIDRYLANEMDSKEKRAFENRLKQDQSLADKLKVYRSTSAVLQAKYQREEKEAMFKHNLAKIMAEKPAKREGKVVKLNWYGWAAAASVALLCVALFYTSLSRPDYSDFANHEPIALVQRGENDDAKLKAQQAFNNGEYKFAVVLFTKLIESDQNNTELKLYKGIALLELDKVNEANELFDAVRKSGSVYKDKATWMRALSALKQKDYATCESFLKEIPKGSDEYDEAQRLLSEL